MNLTNLTTARRNTTATTVKCANGAATKDAHFASSDRNAAKRKQNEQKEFGVLTAVSISANETAH
jgi:hypothetical protein